MAAPISEARLIANRKNAQLSTGPKTVEGKTRSRANAVKHGLTGAGIALPTEDAAAIEARFLEMQEDFGPTSIAGALLIRLAAFMSVRIDRAGQHEAAVLAMAQRHATTEFELARLAEVDRLFDTIETNPREHHRRLQTTVEGVDRLLAALGGVRAQVESGHFKKWSLADRNKVDHLLGGSFTSFPMSRCDVILFALRGNLAHIPAIEQDQMPKDDEARDKYLANELILLVDVECDRLVAVRASIDQAVVTADRLDAARRATLPPTPESILFKKYEAAAISTFLRALRDFQKLEATVPEVEPTQPEPEPTQPDTEPTQPDAEPAVATASPAPDPLVATPQSVAATEPVAVPVVAAPVISNEAKPEAMEINPNYNPRIFNYPTREY